MNIPVIEKKTRFAIAIVLAIGAILLALILSTGKSASSPGGEEPAGHSEKAGHDDGEHHDKPSTAKHDDDKEHGDKEHHAPAYKAGPHGGKLFTKGEFGAEVLLAEEGSDPRHRLWFFEKGKQISPSTVTVTEELSRPLGGVEKITFKVDKDSQLSAQPIAEPHIFSAKIIVRRGSDVLPIELESEEGKIEISDAQLKTAGVQVATAAPASISSAFQLSGEIRFNEDRTAHVVPRMAGVVESVKANIGQVVRKGDLLAVIASSEVSELRSEFLSAQRRQELAQVTYVREKKLWQEKISAEQDYLQAQQVLREAEIATRNARQKLLAIGASSSSTSGALNRFELRAPFDGAIVEKHIALGESVKEDANVFKISDLSSVWADVSVPAKDLGVVRVGEKAVVKATSLAQSATGTVTYVGTLLGEQTRTAKATVTLANPNNAWRPGLFVNVELTADKRDVAVSVLSDAIQAVADKPTVFAKIEGGFIAVPVTLGRSDGKYTEIVSGLKAGTQYAAQGSFVLKAEQGKGSAEHAH
ncbi:efflux RND transporter periplasmic adaptor subunit [Massilia violaceinigra]|uniref:Efflux RND transporter periplasmic adaptor subunit n=1 Tax=Massilia violaceinigra TaxID=2045208 RepID=A0ABY4A6W2_9BURK|nr:efflux RND transporter periplasmic adaptor subunit [Massilia violaceinigra]UOD29276.1 efflux RND transporter periplasmic adaptor subunit [Massilia violaceinigra]